MGLSIVPKSILKDPIEKKVKVDKKSIKTDEDSFYEIDVLKSRKIEKQLRYQIERDIGLININTESLNGRIYEDGELIYEGEYIQGKGYYSDKWYAHGYGRSYYDNGKLEYEGNFVYGSPHGYGKYFYENGQWRWKGNFQAVVGIEVLKLWKSSLGYVDRRGRIKYGKYYDEEGKLIHCGDFDWMGKPIKYMK